MTGILAQPDGTLWVSIGDNADFRYADPRAHRALDLNQGYGKLLHVLPDGKGVPANPYYDPSAPARGRAASTPAGSAARSGSPWTRRPAGRSSPTSAGTSRRRSTWSGRAPATAGPAGRATSGSPGYGDLPSAKASNEHRAAVTPTRTGRSAPRHRRHHLHRHQLPGRTAAPTSSATTAPSGSTRCGTTPRAGSSGAGGGRLRPRERRCRSSSPPRRTATSSTPTSRARRLNRLVYADGNRPPTARATISNDPLDPHRHLQREQVRRPRRRVR